MTKLLNKGDISEIMGLLSQGEIVAFPTDTVFGIGVLYNDLSAINKMKEAKGRDASKPFPLMVASVRQLDKVALIGEREKAIASRYMPGALTLVLKRKDVIPDIAVNGFDTIAVRIPDDYFDLKLLRKAGPMFVTSANLSGQPAANSHQEVLQQLDGRIAAVVRGHSRLQTASTIIDCTGEKLVCLREGTLSFREVEQYAG